MDSEDPLPTRLVAAAFESMPSPALVVDGDLVVHAANRAARGMLGTGSGPAPALHRRGGELLHCIHSFEVGGCGRQDACTDCVIRSAVGGAIRTDRPQRRRTTLELRDGSSVREAPFLVTASPLGLQGTARVVVTLEDLSELIHLEEGVVEAERATEESDALYRSLFGLAPSGVVLLDDAGDIRHFNETAHLQLGYTREEFARLSVSDVDVVEHTPEEVQRHLASIEVAGGEEFEARHRAKSGEIRDVLVRSRPVRAAGRCQYIAVWTDITERKRADEALRKSQRTLQMIMRCNDAILRATTEEELYEAVCKVIVETGGYRLCWVGVAENDARKTVRPVAHAGHDDGYLAFVDIVWADEPRGRGTTGVALREGRIAVGRIDSDSSMAPWREEAIRRGFRSATSLPITHGGEAMGVIVMYAEDDFAFTMEELHSLSRLADNVAFGVRSLRLKREEERHRAELAKSARLAAMGTLVAGVAHEINNPLTGLTAGARIAQEDLRDLQEDYRRAPAMDPEGFLRRSDGVLETLVDIGTSADRISNIVKDLTLLGRPEQPRSRVRLSEVVVDSLGWLAVHDAQRVTVEMQIVRDAEVLASAAQVGQVVLNLVNNAVLAIPEGRAGHVVVRVGAGSSDHACIEVIDDGPGIPPDLKGRIFEPFFTTRRHRKGTGLGLSICHAIVMAHGGVIAVETEVGKGSTFRVELPLAQPGRERVDPG